MAAQVLPPGATQHEVYMSGVKDVVDDVLNGYNGTVCIIADLQALPSMQCTRREERLGEGSV